MQIGYEPVMNRWWTNYEPFMNRLRTGYDYKVYIFLLLTSFDALITNKIVQSFTRIGYEPIIVEQSSDFKT